VLAWPQLKPYVMGPNVMVRLAQRRVWEHKNLWLGCVKCIQMTSALAYPFVLQLPSEQLADVLARIPDMTVPLREYAAVPLRRSKLPTVVLVLLGLEQASAAAPATPAAASPAAASPEAAAAAAPAPASAATAMDTTEEEAPAAAPAAAAAFPALEKAVLAKMKVSELRAELSKRGMDSTGLKAQLLKRLEASFA